METKLPGSPQELLEWSWPQMEPLYQELADRPLDAGSMAEWLSDWSAIADRVNELYHRLYLATTQNTADQQAEAAFASFLDVIYPAAETAEQKLREKLIASGLEPPGFKVQLRNMRAEADLYREANLPLLTQEHKLEMEYDKIIGAETVQWEGQDLTVTQLRPLLQSTDRLQRERVWRLGSERQLADRQAINDLWREFLDLRLQMAANAGLKDYRAFRWQQMLRFDYTPDDCLRFHQAIEQVVVPAALRIYDKRRRRLGIDALRPWDLDVDPLGRPPLVPAGNVEDLKSKAQAIFDRVDPRLGGYFGVMRSEGLLDLDNRKNKAPGAFCTAFDAIRRPFILMNAVGMHDDVQTLLHESGHAFHVFETAGLPYTQQRQTPMEFAEVASMSMELLASPYLAGDGGLYTPAQAARARIDHLERNILFWPYMAVVDAFQHWVYENPQAAHAPDQCDAEWDRLWQRFMPGVDWSGLEQERATGWHRKLHIHTVPFYYVEYGMAQLGATQVWANALRDQAGSVAAYRRALALGGAAPLPELYATAGARFEFDAAILGQAVELMEKVIGDLESQEDYR